MIMDHHSRINMLGWKKNDDIQCERQESETDFPACMEHSKGKDDHSVNADMGQNPTETEWIHLFK
jgi:hypothetical protein